MCTPSADIAKVHHLQELFSLHSAHHLADFSLVTSPSTHKAQTQTELSHFNSCQTGTTLTIQTTCWDHMSPIQKLVVSSHSNLWTALLKSLLSQRDHQLSKHFCMVTLLAQHPDSSNLFVTITGLLKWEGRPPKINSSSSTAMP